MLTCAPEPGNPQHLPLGAAGPSGGSWTAWVEGRGLGQGAGGGPVPPRPGGHGDVAPARHPALCPHPTRAPGSRYPGSVTGAGKPAEGPGGALEGRAGRRGRGELATGCRQRAACCAGWATPAGLSGRSPRGRAESLERGRRWGEAGHVPAPGAVGPCAWAAGTGAVPVPSVGGGGEASVPLQMTSGARRPPASSSGWSATSAAPGTRPRAGPRRPRTLTPAARKVSAP